MGSLIAKGLTRPEVISPDGSVQTVDSPAAAGMAMAAAARNGVNPSTANVNGTLDYNGMVQDEAGGQLRPDTSENLSIVNTPGASTPQPRIVKPSFGDVVAQEGPFSPKLSKGGLLAAVLATAAQGAANGMAASVPINGGRTSVGVGPAMAAGFNVPVENQMRRLSFQREELDQQREAAQIAAMPAMQDLDRRLKQSEIDAREAQANRRENYTVPGVGLVTPDANSPNGYKVVVAEPSKGKSLDDPNERTTYISQIDPKGELLSPRERAGYIATGQWPKETAEHAPSLLQWIADSNSPDPNVSAPAKRNLSAYRQNTAETHQAMRDPGEDGLSAAQMRRLNSDPNYSALKAQRQNLLKVQAESAMWNPDGAAKLGDQISALTAQMQAAQAGILKKGGGFRNLNIAGTSVLSSHAPTVAQATPTTHVFNVAQWKAANPKGDVNAAIAYAKQQGYQVTGQ